MRTAAMPDQPALPCPECDGQMVLRNSRYGLFYGCTEYPDCRATHGAHPDGRPLGTPADQQTKNARKAAHAAFDKLWAEAPVIYDIAETGTERVAVVARIRRIARGRAYRWLSVALGLPFDDCHIGAMDEPTCHAVVAACSGITPAGVRQWYKDPQRPRE